MKPIHLFIRPAQTFAAKIFLVIILLVVFLSVSFTAFFVQNQWKSLTGVLVRQGEMLAKSLAYTARLGVFAENPELLKDPVEGVLQSNEVVRVSVFNAGGKLLVEKGKGRDKEGKGSLQLDDREKKDFFAKLGKTREVQYLKKVSTPWKSGRRSVRVRGILRMRPFFIPIRFSKTGIVPLDLYGLCWISRY